MDPQPMKYIPQQGQTCLVSALAMALEIEYIDVVKMLGHDGTKIQDGGMTGIHPQEVIDVLIKQGVIMVIIEQHPSFVPHNTLNTVSLWDELHREARFRNYIKGRNSVLIGENNQGGPHAVAYDGDKIFDPASSIQYPLEDFTIKEAWLFFHTL